MLAHTGVAALLLSGKTLCSAVNTFNMKKLSTDAILRMLREEIPDSTRVIVLDEVSMMTAKELVLLERRLRDRFGNDRQAVWRCYCHSCR